VIKLYSTIGVRGAVEALLPAAEAKVGDKVAVKIDVTWATAPMLVKRLQAGETADIMILNAAGMETVTASGWIVPGSQAELASSGVGIAVKAGAPKPDISTPEALKKTLLAAKSISYSDPEAGGASGIYFAKLIERMGIADAVNAKKIFPPPAGFCAEFLLTGHAELAIQQRPELMHVKGVEIIGGLPGDLDVVTVFIGGLATACKDQKAGKALLDFLRSAEAKAMFKEKGLMTPA
jgi:molybdate transport system substrate-binding protein